MGPVLFPWMRNRFASLGEAFSDSRIDDDLLRHLVGTLFSPPASLYVSIGMSVALTLGAWAMTHEAVFLVYGGAASIVAIVRMLLVYSYASVPDHAGDTRAQTLYYDRQFLLWGVINALVLGAMDYSLTALPPDNFVRPMAMAVTVGFCVAFVTRSSGRPLLLVLQVIAICAPVIYAFLTLPIPHGPVYAALATAFVGVAAVMGVSANRKIVDFYRASQEINRMVRCDILTGLLNRFACAEALEAKLCEASLKPGRRFAIIMIDLDRFKEINDSLGHSVGDDVIVEMSGRLRSVVRTDDIVARLGGDEFVVLADCPLDAPDFASGVAERIVESVSRPLVKHRVPLPTGASVGVAYFPEHGSTSEELMKKADIALYEAKGRGRKIACVFDQSMQAKLAHALELELEMQRGIAEDQFEPWFQPIQNIDTGVIAGYEALARWRHPTRGMISPAEFVPIAEHTGAIIQIGETILEKACRAAVSWPRNVSVAVNLSPVQFRRPQLLVASVRAVLERTRFDPSRLYLEITESLLMEDTPQTRDAILQLAALGVRFSLDDFGVGYSSLSYIKNYPFSKIKIDKTFIDRVDSDRTSSAIIAAVCVLAERISLEIIAEGVETQIQHMALRNLGLKLAQGYLYGRPQPGIVGSARLALAANE